MRVDRRSVGLAVAALLLTGCTFDPLSVLNSEFLSTLFPTGGSSTLPGDAPGVVVAVRNDTSRWVRAVVSYRDADSNVRNYSTLVAPGEKTAQMLVCPIEEITLGNVADLQAAGAVVFLADSVSADTLDSLPFIEVDAFGVLLREDVNYSCGDGLTFSVRETPGQTKSGYRTRVEVQHAGT